MTKYTSNVIVLFGVRGSGKDTVGHYLHNEHDFAPDSFAYPLKKMVKLAFPDMTDEDLFGPSEGRERQYAQYPRGAQAQCMRCDHWLFENADASPGKEMFCRNCLITYPKFVNPRIALQTLGTEWGRRLSPNVWIDAAVSRVRAERLIWRKRLFGRDKDQRDMPAGLAIQFENEPKFVFTDGRFANEQARCSELGAHTVLLLRKLDESTDTHASEAELKTIPREKFDHVLDNRGTLDELPGLIEAMLKTL